MNKKPFGLDIGASSIKLVWLEKEKDGFILKSAHKVAAPLKGMMSESPLDQEEMAQAIQRSVIESKIASKLVNIAVSESQVYTKVLEMPPLSDRELQSAIYYEAEQYIPVPLANVSLTWSVLERPEKTEAGGKMKVLMVGAPNALINKYKKVLGMAGFEINALVPNTSFPPTLVVNIGALSTSLAIVRNGVLVFTYSQTIGGSAISRAIATDFGFSQAQAEEYKKQYGVLDETLGGKISRVTQPILNAILEEIKKSLVFYAQRYKDFPIAQILLCGGTSRLPGIDAYFAQGSGVETVIANPWKVLVPQEVPKEILDSAPDYTIAVGLAMREDE
jgi:type IV pilus assembly protein PilM